MQRLNEIIKERILILDGAMGTMIQGYGLNEDDFRGQRFKDTTVQMKGNNDMLCLTRRILSSIFIASIWPLALTSLRRTPSPHSASHRLTTSWKTAQGIWLWLVPSWHVRRLMNIQALTSRDL